MPTTTRATPGAKTAISALCSRPCSARTTTPRESVAASQRLPLVNLVGARSTDFVHIAIDS